MGRARQSDRQRGFYMSYAKDEMQKENHSELYGDRSKGMKKMSESTLKNRHEFPEKQPPNMVAYFNPPHGGCHRSVSCAYYGEICQASAVLRYM
jgi:hypothetical protein